MKFIAFIYLLIVPLFALAQTKQDATPERYLPVERVADEFTSLLKRPLADFKPSFQTIRTNSVIIEKGFIYTEETEKLPILIYKPVHSVLTSFPVVICLHGTGGSKDDESIINLLDQFSRIGIMGVAIDARYHGEQVAGGANKAQQYVEAITKAWTNTDSTRKEHPFFFDTVYDLWRLTDYLITRPDVQAKRIGMMGISMGGIETWMAASVDKRIKVAVPVIAAQSFKWSLENNSWEGRARTIWKVHEQVAKDLGDSLVNKNSVKLLWDKLLPGITDQFDCPSMIRLFAPRPLLLLNNEKDLNCPLAGAQVAFKSAIIAYRSKNALNKLKIHVTPGEPHKFLPQHFQMTIAWFKKWL
ncbi:MAG: acetylxylan esterase [Chitinophagaceae bacterium]